MSDIRNYVRSCHICQMVSEKGSVLPAPLKSSYISSSPFEVLDIDLEGEISPTSDRGHMYILSLVDTCTRWVECIPLKYANTQEIVRILSVLQNGFPQCNTIRNGSQFVSRTMRSFTDMLSIVQMFSLIYYALSNRVREKYHRWQKQMLAKVTA